MPCHRVWLGRVLLLSLILSALESHHGIKASSIYRYPAERDVIDEDLDSLIDQFRKIGDKNRDEIAKEKPVLAPYRGGHRGQGYPYDLPNYENEAPGRYYQAVRGQKTKMPGWDRGQGLGQQENEAPPRGHFGKYHHRQETDRQAFRQEFREQPKHVEVPVHEEHIEKEKTMMPGWDRGEGLVQQENEAPQRGHFGKHHHRQFQDQPKQEQVQVPVSEEEHIEKESNPNSDVKIAPVPEEIQEQDQPTHPTPAARQEFDDRLHPVQEVASMADIYFLDVQAPGAAPVASANDESDTTTEAPPSHEKQVAAAPSDDDYTYTLNNQVLTAVVAGCSVAGLVGLVVAGVCWYRLQKNVKAASEVEYPAYGITGPTKGELGSPGDRKLAQSAQMYHYQHQKQQMIALEKANGEMKNDGSEDDSDEENEEGDYTVYECPGLAPTGEMEVKNPLFSEETPVTPTPDDRREMK